MVEETKEKDEIKIEVTEETKPQQDIKRIKLYIAKQDDEILELLSRLLYAYKLIEKPTKSAAMSFCINFTANVFKEYLKAKESGIRG